MYGGRQTHDNTFESRATEGPLLGATSRIDDWLTNKTGEGRLTEREVHERTKTWGGETHMSAHCPLTMKLDSTRVGIKLDGKWADTTAHATRRAKRIRKGLQPEETQAVREMLEDEIGDEVARCTQLIGRVRGVDRQQNGRALEDVAQAIHETLTRSHELVLERVGESVTYTDKMQPGNGPGRRRNQVGYMKESDKR
eukprot:1939200-Pyramimonas_sp.AAC.1